MPQLPTILLSGYHLKLILEALENCRHSGEFFLIDTGHSFTLRDKNHMFLTEVAKMPQEHADPA